MYVTASRETRFANFIDIGTFIALLKLQRFIHFLKYFLIFFVVFTDSDLRRLY